MKDNQSAIKIAHNSENRKKIRDINIRYHFIRQFVANREIEFNEFNFLTNSQMH
jgi:hypothetical protein